MESKRYSKPEKKYSIRQDIEVESETSPLYKARKHIQAEWDRQLILYQFESFFIDCCKVCVRVFQSLNSYYESYGN